MGVYENDNVVWRTKYSDDGKEIQARTTTKCESATRCASVYEHSENGGPWTLWAKGSATKIDASADKTTATSSAPVSGFQWTLPASWRKETIPFPLEFAPDIKHRGIVELRFSPGFFDSAAPDFWSYSFVWWLEDDKAPTRQQLSDELTRYFFGLNKLVAGDKYPVRIEQFRVDLKDDTVTKPQRGKALSKHYDLGQRALSNHERSG